MANTPLTYAQVKTAVAAEGYPVSSSGWQGLDVRSYDQFAASAAYNAGQPFTRAQSQYGFAYAGEMPSSVTNEVAGDAYTATLAGAPLTGAHPTVVTYTMTEPGAAGTSFAWTFGDGATTTTTVNHTTHSYAAAGSFTCHVVPTVNGKVMPSIAVTAPSVIS